MIDKEKVAFAAKKITMSLERMQFNADESICLLKCLERTLVCQAIEKDLVVASKTKIMEVINGRAPIESILPDNAL